MLQDLQRGRRTEIDAINGAIWRYGQQLGISTPFNEIMTRLIWERERKFGEARCIPSMS
jgi:2-dehydropantoate 2-reductase